YLARRGQALEPGLRRIQARAGGEGRRRTGAADSHSAPAQLAHLPQRVGLNIHVRVIKPVAVDRTEVTIYPIRLLGAPPAMNFGNIRLLNVTHSASSFVQTDDLESFVRAQKGLRSCATDWVDISRGLGEEEPDRELNATRALATHEMVVRAQYKAWLGY